MRHFIGYKGNAEVEKYFNAITTELHEKFGVSNLSLRVPPHLTLKYPFEMEDTSDVENRISEFLINKRSFQFIIDGFGRLDDNNETIFLSPTRTDTLDAFVKDCIVTLGDLNEEKKFDPEKFRVHMSVARHLDDKLFEQIWNYVNALSRPRFELPFDNLTLFKFENEKWGVKRAFLLN